MVNDFANFILVYVVEPIGIIVLTNSSGVITSPNFPNNYPNNFNCKWRISPETSHVNITIEYFKVGTQINSYID